MLVKLFKWSFSDPLSLLLLCCYFIIIIAIYCHSFVYWFVCMTVVLFSSILRLTKVCTSTTLILVAIVSVYFYFLVGRIYATDGIKTTILIINHQEVKLVHELHGKAGDRHHRKLRETTHLFQQLSVVLQERNAVSFQRATENARHESARKETARHEDTNKNQLGICKKIFIRSTALYAAHFTLQNRL